MLTPPIQTVRRVAVVSHVHVDESNSKQTTSHHLLLHRVEVVIHPGKAVLHVPEQDRTEARSRGHFSVVLVLEDPAHIGTCTSPGLTLSPRPHPRTQWRSLSCPKPAHKSVDEVAAKFASAVKRSSSRRTTFHKVRLVDFLRQLGFHDVEVTCKSECSWR